MKIKPENLENTISNEEIFEENTTTQNNNNKKLTNQEIKEFIYINDNM